MHLFTRTPLVFVLAMLCAFPSMVYAQNPWQVVVLPEPSAEITLNTQPLYQAVQLELSRQLTQLNHDVYQPQAIGIANCIKESCSQLSINDIRKASFSAKRPVSLVLYYHVNVTSRQRTAITEYKVEVKGQFVDVDLGTYQDAFNTTNPFTDLPVNCRQDCYNAWLEDKANATAQDVGYVLAENLSLVPQYYRYTITFSKFAQSELQQAYSKLASSDRARHLDLINRFDSEAQWLHSIGSATYRFVTNVNASQVQAVLVDFFDTQGIAVLPSYNERTRVYTFTRSGMPYTSYYVAAAVGLILLCYVVYARQLRVKHQRVLDTYATGNNGDQWLNHFNTMRTPMVPFKAVWFTQKKQWETQLQASAKHAENAWLAIDKGNYTHARQCIDDALHINADNTRALELKNHIIDYQRGHERYTLAEQEVTSHPASAITLLEEAKLLNPRLSEKIDPLISQCRSNLHKVLATQTLTNAQTFIDDGQDYPALSLIDQAINQISEMAAFSDELHQLTSMRKTVEQRCTPLNDALVGSGALAKTYLLTRPSILLGRAKATTPNTIAVSYKRVSSAQKQVQIERNGEQYFLTDINSTNGSRYNNQLLPSGTKVKAQHNAILAAGMGKTSADNGFCQWKTQVSEYSPGSLIIALEQTGAQFLDDSALGAAWANIDQELGSTWALIHNKLALGISHNNTLDIGCVNESTPQAYVLYDNGFYLAPAKQRVENANLFINNVAVYGKVPLMAGAKITLGELHMELEALV